MGKKGNSVDLCVGNKPCSLELKRLKVLRSQQLMSVITDRTTENAVPGLLEQTLMKSSV